MSKDNETPKIERLKMTMLDKIAMSKKGKTTNVEEWNQLWSIHG